MATPSYATYPSLVDRTAFVTGGADGIGRAIVQELAKQGAVVGFADRNREKAESNIAECVELGVAHAPRFYEVDLTDIGAFQAVMATALDDYGPIRVLVNNAANDDRHDWRDVTVDYWDDRMATNLRHYFFAIQGLAPAMIEAGDGGSIVNIGSSSYKMKEDGFPGYASAKAGVEGLTRTFARTFGVHGITVNTVSPGWVVTERQLEKWWSPEDEQETMDDQQIKRRIYPREFAQMVLFLAADDGAACSAQEYLVDGGRF